MYAQDSIELLKQSGINFAQNEARGVDVQRFGEVLMSSGIVLNDEVRASGLSHLPPRLAASEATKNASCHPLLFYQR